jgi:hypothetical protein
MQQSRFELTLESAPGWSVPAIVRLRKALKALLRGYGLKCVDLAEVLPTEPRDDQPTHKERSEERTCER